MSQPSTDVPAIVPILDAVLTQLRRIADALSTPVAIVRDGVTTPLDDVATTPATTCSALHTGFPGDHRECIRAAQHPGDHIDEQGYHWSDTVAIYPVAPAVEKIAHHIPAGAYRTWTDQAPAADGDDDPPVACWHTEPGTPCDWNVCRQPERLAAEDRGTDPATTPAGRPACVPDHATTSNCPGCTWDRGHPTDDEDEQRTARRKSLHGLLDRLTHYGRLSENEIALLRQHALAEQWEADTARAVAAGNLRHVPEIDRLTAELEDAETRADGFRQQRDRSDEAARRALEQRQEMAEERYAWQQRGDRAEAAIERVRERCHGVRDRSGPGGMINASQILGLLSPTWPDGNYEAPSPGAALDGTEQPTTTDESLT